jgi:1-acyl-sn-glycerol-3-phosphate acyltransferase
VANHASFLDIPILSASFRCHVTFVARNTLTESRFIAWVIRVCGGILIRPGEGDRTALRAIGERLRAGYAVAIFPEGTRTSDGRLGEFRGGAVFAAKRSGVALLPVGIRGSFEAFSRHHRIPRPRRIHITIGAPLDPGDPQASERLRGAIEQLLALPQQTPHASEERRSGMI